VTKDAYITKISSFLPNDPVGNDEIEDVLGLVNNQKSRARRVVLRNNGIKQRYYAIDKQSKELTHNNAQLAAEAIKKLAAQGFPINQIECLCCGTTRPDQITPNHAVMVHGELGIPPCEVVSTSGVCASGISSLKFGYMSVKSGLSRNAVTCGSELPSLSMLGSNFTSEDDATVDHLSKRPELAFEKDFLRWMLSDGAGCVLIQPEPNANSISLRIDWIDQLSYANEQDACMYAGAVKLENGKLKGWREFKLHNSEEVSNVFALKQDVRQLNEKIVSLTVEKGLSTIADKRRLNPQDIDYFLPHYSSEYFRDKLAKGLENIGFPIPQEKWFTNLVNKGNTGAASMYIMLEEIFNGNQLKSGDRLLCFIPESGRFLTAYMHLTVV